MKKLLKTGKKALSVIMAVMMVLTAWVWVAPTEASAATAGNYKVRITWQNNNKKKYSNQFTGTETEQGARAGFILYYKSNNGTGTESKVYWDIGWNNESGKGAIGGTRVSGSNSTGWTNSDTGKDYTCEATIAGFPTALFGMADSDDITDKGIYTVKKLEVYSNAESKWITLWAGEGYTNSSTEKKTWKITADGTGANGVKTVTETGNDSKYGYASSTTENWKFPTPTTTTTYTGKIDNVSVPESGTADVMTVKVIANDQYGVQMGTPTWSVSRNGANGDNSGISVSPTSGDSTTVKLTNAANVTSNVDTQTGTITATWGSAGSLSDTFTITDSYYTATFNYQIQNADNKTSSTKTEKREGYHGDSITEPTPPQYYDQDYLKTFDKWSPTYSSTITKDVTYAATYTEKFVSAIYKAVDDAIAAVDEVKTEWGDDYQSRFTYSSRKAIDDAIKAVVTGLGRTQQETVDGYAAAINAALAALETNKYAVIFLDNNGSILLYEKNAEYKSFVKAPDFPDAQKKYYDSEKHYEYTGWDSSEYTSVTDDLVIAPVYAAEAHNFTRTEEVTSTCTQKGATRYICDCGYSYIVDKGDYGDHVWGEFKTDIHPTCTTAGQKSKYCTVEGCNAQTDITVIDPLGHQWGTVSSLAPATCDRDGINTRLCDACGVCEHTIVPATGHNYTKTTVAPTCTAKGYDEYVCQNDTCGHSYKDNFTDMLDHVYTEEILSAAKCDIPGVKKLTCACGHVKTEAIPALSHDNVDDIEWDVIVPATCEYAGYKTKTCLKCGNVIKAETIDALTHDLETTTTPATCTTAGTTVVSCKRENCGYEKTTVTQPLTHDWNNGVEKKADCTHSAYTLYTCQRENCGETKIEVKDESAPALGHDFSGKGVTTPATCTSGAYITYTCQNGDCKETKIEVVNGSQALGHEFKGKETTVTVATCEANGKKTVQCTRCDATTEVVIPRLGHNYGEWDKTPATNDTDGKWTRECANCSDVEEITIPAGGHTLVKDTDNSYAATCTSKGQEAYKCNNPAHTNCSVKVTVELDYAQHTITNDNKAATCEEAGWSKTFCSVCKQEFNSYDIPATGHNFSGTETIVTEATCTNNGKKTVKCKNCNVTTDVVLPKLGHNFDESIEANVTIEKATCESNGSKTVKCSRCDETKVSVLPKLGHKYEKKGAVVTTAATCEHGAYTTYNCDNCEYSYVVNVQNSTLADHTWKTVEEKAADCENNGFIKSECSVCNAEKEEVLPRLGHAYGEWDKTTDPATNDKDGTWTRICAIDASHVETVKIPKGGHTFGTTPDSKVDETCTTPGSATYNCKTEGHTNCGVSITVTVPVKQHTITQKVTKEATCTEKGEVESYCSICGESFSTVETPVIPHTYVEKEKVAATCTTGGYTVMACECGTSSYNLYDANTTGIGHDYSVEKAVVDSTCTTHGSKTFKCSRCEATKDIELPLVNHKYVADGDLVAATCTTPATQAYECDYCGEAKYTEYVSGTIAHNFGDWTVIQEATTDSYGIAKRSCTANGCTAEEYQTTPPTGAHSFKKASETPATCTNEGSIEWQCETHENCEANYTETLNKLPHTQTIEYNAPTCVAEGSSKVVCSVEGCRAEILSSTIPVITYHNFSGNGVITTEASCEGTGIMTYTCLTDGCNETKTEVIPAKGHTFVTTVTDATCEGTGSVVISCSTCNDAKHTTTVELTKKNHAWNDGEIKEGDAATCEGTGTKTFTCSACNATKTETIPANGHSWSAWTKIDATATTDGYWERTCSACPKTESLTIPRGHNLVKDDKKSEAATCKAEGKEVYSCDVHTDCGVTIEVTLPKLQHKYTTAYLNATCSSLGYVKTTCSECGFILVDKVIDRLAHTLVEGREVPSTCSTAAYIPYNCEKCNYEYQAFVATSVLKPHSFVESASTATCTSPGHKTLTCKTCNYSTNVNVPALGHNYEAQGNVVPATCTTPATQVYKCTPCGAAYTKLVEEEKGHSFGNWTVTQVATTDKFGIQERNCSVCGYVEYDKIAPIGNHVFKEEVISNATCTTNGLISYTCTVATHGTCSANYTKTISATGHTEAFDYKAADCDDAGHVKTYCSACTVELSNDKIPALGCSWVQGEVTAATCNTIGSIAYECSRCGSDKSAELPTNANAHQYETVVTKATCYSEGSAVTKCKLCQNELSVVTLAKVEHSWNNGEVTKSATCTSEGTKTYTCIVEKCTATKTEPIDALGHNWDNWFVEKASTNTDKGVMKRICKNDNKHFETHEIPAGGHEWDDGEVTKEASCTETGTKVYACKNHTGDNACGITFTVTLDKLQHELVTTSEPATCFDSGEVVTKCKNCETETHTTIIPATGHIYDGGNKTPATCTSTGKIVYTCTYDNCNDTKEVILDKLQHVYEQQGDTVAPTCTSSGYTNYKCKTCTSSYAVIGASATGHKFDDSIEANVTVVPSTCNTEGTKTVKCKACNEKNTVVIPKTGHNYEKGAVVNADCKNAGTEVYTCTCGDTYTKYIEAAKPHAYGEWETVTAATADKNGVQKRICSVCNDVEYGLIAPIGDHVFTEELEKAATCTETGKKVYTCDAHTNCSANYEETIPATGHNGKLSYSAATCTGEGSTKIVCETCKNTIGDVETIPALGHLFNGTGVYTPATCVAEGSMTYTCTRCNDATHTTKIAVDPDAHELTTVTQPQSCKAEGSVITSCTLCKKELVITTLPKLQHSWGAWTTIQASTNTATGLMSRTCANGCTEEVEIPAGGHTLTETARTNSTCTVAGSVTYECKVEHTGGVTCGVQVTVELPLAQHTVITETEAATCTKEGFVKSYCSADGCNKVFADVKLAKLQHVFELNATTDATCTMSGYKIYKCKTCDETYDEINGNANGHDLEETVTSGSCTKAGEVVLSCKTKDCDYSVTVSVPALGHDYKLISSTTATCAAAATETYKCSRCEASYTVSVGDKLTDDSAHNWSTWTVVVEATYTTLGCESRSCPDCGKVEIKTIEAIGDHAFVDGKIAETKAATCTENGYIIRKCTKHSDCGLTSTEILPVIDHTTETLKAVDATCEGTGLTAGSKCSKCDTVLVEQKLVPALGHKWIKGEIKDATCIAEGSITYNCDNCGDTATVEIPASDNAHNYTTKTTPVSCTTDGTVVTTCSLCGDSTTVKIPAKGHDFSGTETLVKAATCTADGLKTLKCANCNETTEVVISKLGHKMVAGEAVAATCTTSGYTPYTCENIFGEDKCSESYVVYDGEVVEHNYVQVEGSSTATCLAGGTVTMQCSHCKDEITAAVPALGHSYGDWATTEPTAETEGEKVRKCSRCNVEETVVLPKLGHEMVKDESASTKASCTAEGNDVYVCKTHTGNAACGYIYSVVVPVLAHNYDESIDTKVTTVAPTCTENGSKTVECKDCNATVTTVIPRTGHTMSTTVTEATCKAAGLVETKCTACDYKLPDKVLEQKAHKLSISTAYPGCEKEGYVKAVCDSCKATIYTEALAALGHCYEGTETTIKAATCTEPGSKTVKCIRCDKTTTVTIPATGHSYVKGESVAPTCTTSGYTVYTCACKASYNKLEAEAIGHKWNAGTVTTAATCEKNGEKTYACENEGCKAAKTEVIAKYGHSWTGWTITTEPTADKEGIKTRTCLRSGCEETVTIPALGGASAKYTVEFVVDGKVVATQSINHGGNATAPEISTKAPDVNYHYTYVWDTDYTNVTANLTVTAEIVPVLHTYGKWITDADADCKNEGLRHRECTCGYVDQEVISKLAHSLSVTVKENPATCTENGYKVVACKNCGVEETQTLKRLGHSMTYYSGYAATCDSEGIANHYNCSRCGKDFEDKNGIIEITSVILVKKYHTFVVVDGSTATCTSDGITDYRFCTMCGYVQHSETIPALGHIDTDRNDRCDRCSILYENNGANICSCNCHKTGMINEIFYKILLFFWKLFGITKSCGCGTVHY